MTNPHDLPAAHLRIANMEAALWLAFSRLVARALGVKETKVQREMTVEER